MISKEQLETLYKQYMSIVDLEVNQFGCKPTEVRHLIGRLGEFYCAIKVNGTLATEANQHGFDVVSGSGSRISVKTTAQKSGFITVNPKTLDKVDELMILQFVGGQLHVVFFGAIAKAVEVARIWDGKYEIDIAKARKLI